MATMSAGNTKGPLIAAVLIAAYALALLLAASPVLHHCLHHDSDQPDHVCAVTCVIDGRLDRSVPQSPRIEGPLATELFAFAARATSAVQGSGPAAPGERGPPRA